MLPHLTEVERGKHPEGGGGEERENQGGRHLSEAVEKAGCLSPFHSVTTWISLLCTSSLRLT